MANWDNEVAQSNLNAGSYTSNQIAGREGSRAGVGNTTKSEYSVVGINVNKIPDVQNAIDEYVRGLEEHINQIEANADPNAAFLSEDVQASVKNYLEKVKTYCKNLESQLIAFSDKLSEVRTAWETGTKNIASGVDSSNAAFSEGTRYTRQS